MNVYESRFLHSVFYTEQGVFENIWLPETTNMTPEEYKTESLNFLQKILELKPTKFMADTREMNFGITLDLQEWTNASILVPALGVGINKVAFLVSKEFITQISIEQTMEENEEAQFITRFFDDRETAWNWLNPA